MKKIIWLMFVFGILFGGITNAADAKEQKPIEVLMDGERIPFNVQPIIDSGVTLVQFRPIFEKMGLKVGWDSKTQTVTGTKTTEEGTITIKLVVGSKKAEVSPGKTMSLEVAPKIINGSTMIPLRFVGEASSYQVSWNPAGIVTLKTVLVGVKEFNDKIYNIVQIAPTLRIGVSAKVGESDENENMYYIVFFNDGVKEIDLKGTSIYAKLTNTLTSEINDSNTTLEGEGKLFNSQTIIKPGEYYESIVVFSKRYEWNGLSIGKGLSIPMPKSK